MAGRLAGWLAGLLAGWWLGGWLYVDIPVAASHFWGLHTRVQQPFQGPPG